MKYLLFVLMTILAVHPVKADTLNYNITFQVDGIRNDKAVLAYYYMDKKYISDTVVFNDRGIGQIKGEKNIEGGVYLLAFPSLNLRYFELILGNEPSFNMKTDTSDFVANMTISGSVENKLFYDYMRFMVEKGEAAAKLKEQIRELDKTSKEYQAAEAQLKAIDKAVKAERDRMIRKYPDAFYVKLVKAMMDIDVPENPNPADSGYVYRYYHDHYFDHVDFSDARMARTPFFLKKVLAYLDDYTLPLPDSIIAAADMIIERSRVNEEIFQVCLVGIFNKYARSKIMSHELIYVHLAKKYYLSGVADWVTDEQLNTFRERINSMEPTLLGKTAPEIVITDYNQQTRRLSIETAANDYTVLIFWNSDCGHCQKQVPLLRDLYRDELSDLGKIGVFAISTEQETNEWQEFIKNKELILDGWINAHDPHGRNPFRALYDVESTPLVFVLDQQRKILAKRIGLEDIKGLIEYDARKKQRAGGSE